MEFEDLPEELKLIAASNMDRESLLNMCQSNRQWNKLCQDQHLWRDLFERDFGRKTITSDPYQEYRFLYIALKNVEMLYYPIFRKHLAGHLLKLADTVKSVDPDLDEDDRADAINDHEAETMADIFINNPSFIYRDMDTYDNIDDRITNFAFKMDEIME